MQRNRCICQGEGELLTAQPFSANNLHVCIDGEFLQIFDDDPEQSPVYAHINFCPCCGKRLIEKVNTA